MSKAAIVGYRHDIKGQGIYAYVTLVSGEPPSAELHKEIVEVGLNGANSMPTNDYRRVLDDPAFQNLVRERSGFAWSLLAAMLIIYYGFIMLVAFAKPLLAAKVGSGVTSVGIVLGLAVIVSACVLTGLYVQRANSRFDELTRTLIRDLTR